MLLLKLRVYYDEVIDERLHLLLQSYNAVEVDFTRVLSDIVSSTLQAERKSEHVPKVQPHRSFSPSKNSTFSSVVNAPRRDLKNKNNRQTSSRIIFR